MLVRLAKKQVRETVGLWPALEFRNRVKSGGNAWMNRTIEDREFRRLAAGMPIIHGSVACIIPTYRRNRLLVEAVESVLAQDRSDLIALVVDDGGGLPALPNDKRLFAVSLSRNTGIVGIARNIGVRLSYSDYIAFLDDDNRWHPNHLSIAISHLQEGADVVYTAIERKRQDGSTLDVLSKPFDRRELANAPGWLDINGVVLKRSAFKPFSRMNRPVGLYPREDWEFMWRVTGRAITKHIPTVTVDYLVNQKSYYSDWVKSQILSPGVAT